MRLELTIAPGYCPTCGKRPYKSVEAARASARALRRTLGPTEPYYSNECGYWHLTGRQR